MRQEYYHEGSGFEVWAHFDIPEIIHDGGTTNISSSCFEFSDKQTAINFANDLSDLHPHGVKISVIKRPPSPIEEIEWKGVPADGA